MKYVRQFLIILVISFIGELLRYYIPLKIPASIYGLVLLFAALELRIIKLVSIRETSRFLIEIMPLMFVPAGVGLLSSWGVLKPVCVPIMVIVLISTIIVMAVSGKVTQGVIRMEKKHPKKKNGADKYDFLREPWSWDSKNFVKLCFTKFLLRSPAECPANRNIIFRLYRFSFHKPIKSRLVRGRLYLPFKPEESTTELRHYARETPV